MKTVAELNVKIFADGADLASMQALYQNPLVKGFTTNPSLMKKAGVTDYPAFARQVIDAIPDRSLSFEVFSDEFEEMERQALTIASWGENVYAKIPVTNSVGESSLPLVKRLAQAGVKQNVTALMTLDQVEAVVAALAGGPSSYVSVFAGRIADTGIDPLPIMRDTLSIMQAEPQLELIWASPREVFNVFQADELGCHIITATKAIIDGLANVGRDLTQYSLDTVKAFRDDSVRAGFSIDTSKVSA